LTPSILESSSSETPSGTWMLAPWKTFGSDSKRWRTVYLMPLRSTAASVWLKACEGRSESAQGSPPSRGLNEEEGRGTHGKRGEAALGEGTRRGVDLDKVTVAHVARSGRVVLLEGRRDPDEEEEGDAEERHLGAGGRRLQGEATASRKEGTADAHASKSRGARARDDERQQPGRCCQLRGSSFAARAP